LSADVLKVGHHGSDTSSSYVFLREIMPKYAVIQSGKGNSYGHPHEAVTSRLQDAGALILRNDEMRDIVISSDGQNLTINDHESNSFASLETNTSELGYKEDVELPEIEYIGNKKSKKFHEPTCHSLPKESNRISFSNREEAVNGGFSPCGNCEP
ncbi:MAG: MBL fold metallo-hydrolase, partial [Clostridiales bacterium]|nr:MBL fold metallo-hydrolase [Clostridiales bacterium]